MNKTIETQYLVGSSELCRRAGITPQTLNYIINHDSDFPKPVFTSAGKKRQRHYFDSREVLAYLANRKKMKRGEVSSLGARIVKLAILKPEAYEQIMAILAEAEKR